MPDPNKIQAEGFKKAIENPFFSAIKPGQPFQPENFTPLRSMHETFEKPEPYVKKDEKIKELTERVEALENLIKITFDGHVLIDGRFVKVLP